MARARLVTVATGNEFRRARRDLAHHAIDRRGPVLGDDHGVCAGRIRGPQARAEIVGVRDPVQHQEQGALDFT